MEAYIHKQIHEALLEAKHTLLICDERLDGDSLGSTLAMADYLHAQGKSYDVYVSSSIPSVYQELPRIQECTDDVSILQNPSIDLVAVFDCSDTAYVRALTKRMARSDVRVINIDHHDTNARYGHINQVIVDAPATTVIVHDFFQENHLFLSPSAATCLLTGLCFDTSAFTNSATTERAFDVASDLVLSGARVQEVLSKLFRHRSLATLRVWGRALERLHEHPIHPLVTTCITRGDIDETQVNEDEMDGLSNFLQLVTNTDTICTMRETSNGAVKVSLRSRLQDVSAIASLFGGGGHKRAAGFLIPESRLFENPDGTWRVEKKSL